MKGFGTILPLYSDLCLRLVDNEHVNFVAKHFIARDFLDVVFPNSLFKVSEADSIADLKFTARLHLGQLRKVPAVRGFISSSGFVEFLEIAVLFEEFKIAIRLGHGNK